MVVTKPYTKNPENGSVGHIFNSWRPDFTIRLGENGGHETVHQKSKNEPVEATIGSYTNCAPHMEVATDARIAQGRPIASPQWKILRVKPLVYEDMHQKLSKNT